MYYVYVFKSLKDGGLYIGQTSNLAKRIKWHNEKLQVSTKHRVPFELIYHEEYNTRKEAMAREKILKTGKGREFLDSKEGICNYK